MDEEFYNSLSKLDHSPLAPRQSVLGPRPSALGKASLAGRAATFAGKEGNGDRNPRILTM
jgi:hypothetical protein